MEEQQNIMNFLLHTADISHCSKDFNISFKWTNLLNEEFWREGDEEKDDEQDDEMFKTVGTMKITKEKTFTENKITKKKCC